MKKTGGVRCPILLRYSEPQLAMLHVSRYERFPDGGPLIEEPTASVDAFSLQFP